MNHTVIRVFVFFIVPVHQHVNKVCCFWTKIFSTLRKGKSKQNARTRTGLRKTSKSFIHIRRYSTVCMAFRYELRVCIHYDVLMEEKSCECEVSFYTLAFIERAILCFCQRVLSYKLAIHNYTTLHR